MRVGLMAENPLERAVLATGRGTAGLHLATPVWAILAGRRWLAADERTRS
ncbi:MAG: hypothetical protein H0W81_01515 [Chloroflexi bacterium]|nr:hypothetical protein [Chloroflexota bacterium]